MNIILTKILYFDNESKSLNTVRVLTDGKKVLTDSKAKAFIKARLNTGDKFVEKSKDIFDVDISDILETPLQELIEKSNKEIPLYIVKEN